MCGARLLETGLGLSAGGSPFVKRTPITYASGGASATGLHCRSGGVLSRAHAVHQSSYGKLARRAATPDNDMTVAASNALASVAVQQPTAAPTVIYSFRTFPRREAPVMDPTKTVPLARWCVRDREEAWLGERHFKVASSATWRHCR